MHEICAHANRRGKGVRVYSDTPAHGAGTARATYEMKILCRIDVRVPGGISHFCWRGVGSVFDSLPRLLLRVASNV